MTVKTVKYRTVLVRMSANIMGERNTAIYDIALWIEA